MTNKMASTIVIKSDQLNGDDLIKGNIIIKVTGVKIVSDPQQPCQISYEGDNKKPYKPSLTMRKIIIACWGENEDDYIGRSMELHLDKDIKFGKETVGGIVINAMSDIKETFRVPLTVTRGRKKLFTVLRLNMKKEYSEDLQNQVLDALNSIDRTFEAFQKAIDSVIFRKEPDIKLLTVEECKKIIAYLGGAKWLQ